MAFTEGANAGTSNNTTDVTVVASPSSSQQRIVKAITVYNNDTAAATVTLKYYDGTNARTICKITLQTSDTLIYDSVIVLDGTTDLVQLVLSGAITTNQLHFTSHYGTVS